ncbi:hypothetical protein KZX46_14585 [Polymorphobacter sp. PAMC 29334]|uniref:hypothetical protein n=1 Tax=Polymorphobacter sp. PAMC 29334 TaxID=2862331 RepID=UPI001C76E590|nr:hypothetical protein [Polymorphobacter sp. PAMC 29334]QYE34029.1 hypothetical protein KZX46_14585 [Polymorphobacter sp. PAMC 29334]
MPLVGGLTVLERQTRQVRRAGIARVLVVDEGPLDWATLNGDVVVIDTGVVLDDRIVAALALATAPAIATWPAASGRGSERIDAQDMTAGIALYPASLVRDTAASLGDWDLAPTLLRAGLMAGAMRVDMTRLSLFEATLDRDVPLVWAQPDDADGAEKTTVALIAATQPGCRDAPGRWLETPAEDAAVRLLLPLRVPADAVALIAIGFATGSATAFALGWMWIGLLFALLCGPIAGTAAKLAGVRVERVRVGGDAIEFAPYGWFIAAAAHFAAIGTTTAWPVAALLIGFMLAERIQRGFFRRLTGSTLDLAGTFEARFGLIAARRGTLLWSWLAFAPFGAWFAGFVVLAAYATASFFAAQWRTFKRLGAAR